MLTVMVFPADSTVVVAGVGERNKVQVELVNGYPKNHTENNTQTWCYNVTVLATQGDLSHWDLDLCDNPTHNVTKSSPYTNSFNDPTWDGGAHGNLIKWDVAIATGESATFCFTLRGIWESTQVKWFAKDGKPWGDPATDTGNVTGPSCSELSLCSLTVISDGCCNIAVGWDSESANVNANASANFIIPCCTNVTLTANASACCSFDYWTGDVPGGTNSTNPITIHIDGSKNVTATCHWLSYNLTTNAKPPEGGTVSGGGTYNCCTNVTLSATPADSCWYFTGWSGDLAGTNSTETTHMDGDKNVTANFARYSYNLTVSSDGCCPIQVTYNSSAANVTANMDGGGSQTLTDIPCCTDVAITANNSSSCHFVEWMVDGAGQGVGVNNITVHMGANHTAIATCSDTITCCIGDTLFYDNNGNGVRDPYEPGIPGVQVNLYGDDGNGVFNPSGGTDDLLASVITDAAGKYKFTGLNCSDTYWVYVVPETLPPGLTLTTGGNPWGLIALDPEGEVYDLADFGYQPPIPVGGEAYPVNKASLLAPWIAVGVVLAGGVSWYVLRRRRARS